jgi:serine phosphatase RsbU (regulator of sigma subunit)
VEDVVVDAREQGETAEGAAPRDGDGALAALVEASRAVVAAAARATDSDLALARVLDGDGTAASVRAVHSSSAALSAELEASRLPADELPHEERDEGGALADLVRATARRAAADSVLQIPVTIGARTLGTLELYRARAPFSPEERVLARFAAAQVGAALRTLGPPAGGEKDGVRERSLTLAGEALAAGFDEGRTADEVVRLAAEATGARRCTLWRRGRTGVEAAASFGPPLDRLALRRARRLAEDALAVRDPVSLAPAGAAGEAVATIQLGHPVNSALQLGFGEDGAPSPADVGALATFGVRAAHALRAGARARSNALELERTRAVMAIVTEANAQLSLSHTLATVVDRVAELLGVDRVAVYLRDDEELLPAAGRAVAGPHTPVAERLLELALDRRGTRGVVVVDDLLGDARFAGLEAALEQTGIETAVAMPLVVPGEVTGLLAVYPPGQLVLDPNEIELLSALAGQLAVSVQNAWLHEQARQLGADLEEALGAERQASAQMRSLYEISRSFAQSLSLETTLDAAARSIVELLEVDAAVIRMPDSRGELLEPRAIHVADVKLAASVRAILDRPQRMDRLPGRRLFRTGRPLVLSPETAQKMGPPHALLVPFLEKGSTAVVLPISTPGEMLGTLKLLSLDPARPITPETVEIGLYVAAQAAFAIENARLYQQQKALLDAMQRSLLPREEPQLPGLDLGAVYESSARVDVGGDVYDFLTLEGDRLAVVLGDVTGHGIDAAADMAMAKFVFRSLARVHASPGQFLAAANDVVCDEIASGKFITMLYVVIDPAGGELSCASAGHPKPRLVLPDGEVRPVEVRGLALGVERDQAYVDTRAQLPPGAGVVLYTDGVVEARRDGEFYGSERLDQLLATRSELSAAELARAVLDDCRSFAGGDLSDDCAVVVIKRVPAE